MYNRKLNDNVLTITETNKGNWIRRESNGIVSANILYLDREYEEIQVNCMLPLKIDAIIPHENRNGMIVKMSGDFIIYGIRTDHAELMMWHSKWWDRSTR